MLYGNCVEGVVDGVPQMRMAVFAPDQVEIEDTWSVSGLCGTGSHHIRGRPTLVVPAERTLASDSTDEPCLDEPVVRIPVPALIALMIASVAVGIAQGALDDTVALAGHKVPLLADAPLSADALFQTDLATADTELRAARALLHESAGRCGRPPWRASRSRCGNGRRRARPPSGRRTGRRRWSRRPTAAAAGPRSTGPARCSAACATSTR